MMPGENQAKTAGVAPDGRAGTCENCAVLSETLHEYMASFLALKQKIFETDKLLNEFKEKSDEFKRTQRENVELHGHLDQLLLGIAPFENVHKNDMHMLDELEITKRFLKRCRDGETDRSTDPEARTLKDQIIFQLKLLQDSNLKQNAEVALLQKENKALEYKLQTAQEKLGKLEKELNKEKSSLGVQTDRKELCCTEVQTEVPEKCSVSMQTKPTCESSVPVQTDPTEESMMDLVKIRRLVMDLWCNVDPLSRSASPLLAVGQAGNPVPKEHLSPSPVPPPLVVLNKTPIKSAIRLVCNETLVSVEDILQMFMPLPPLLSPVHQPEYLGGDEDDCMQLSEKDEDEIEHHIFKEEDMKEVKLSHNKAPPVGLNSLRSLAISSDNHKEAVSPTESPSEGKPDQHFLAVRQDQEGEALCLQVSMNVKSNWSSAVVPEASELPNGNPESEERLVDEDMEAEMGIDDATSVDKSCNKSIADMKLNPFAMYSTSFVNNNQSNGNHSSSSAGPSRDPHCSIVSGYTDGVRHSKTKVENTDVKHNRLVNGTASPQHVEASVFSKEQKTPHKKSSTDHDNILKPWDKNWIMQNNEGYPGNAVHLESVKGEQNRLDQTFDVMELGTVAQNGQKDNDENPASSRFTELEHKNRHRHSLIHGDANSTLTGWPHTSSYDVRNSGEEICKDLTKSSKKITEDGCVDTESSEDLELFGLQRKVRGAQSRQRPKGSPGTVNGFSENGKEHSEEEPLEDTLACSIDVKAPNYMVRGDGESAENSPNEEALSMASQRQEPQRSPGTVNGFNKKEEEADSGEKSFEDLLACSSDVKAPNYMVTEEGESAEKSPNEEGISMASQKESMTQGGKESIARCSWGKAEHSNKCLNGMSAQENKQNMQPKAHPEIACLPQLTEDQSITNPPEDQSVITNGTPTPNSPVDGIVPENGFEDVSSALSKDEGLYTRVKSMTREYPQPTGVTSVMPPECIKNIRSMMGPPLRPVVLPLLATPPKSVRSELRSGPAIARLSQDGSETATSMPSMNPTLQNGSLHPVSLSPASITTPIIITTPSPCKSVPSSPLQFGSATPKHAVPVPCRHPVSALNSMSPAATSANSTPPKQENSMQMLDSMYPELSAQARTLSILRGNVSLGNRNTCTAGGGSGSEPSTPPTLTNGNSGVPTVTPSSHFNSVATAFTKTQQTGKRAGTNAPLPKSAKKLRLGGSPVTIGTRPPSDLAVAPLPDSGEAKVPQPVRAVNGLHVVKKDTVAQVEEVANGKEGVISEVLAKLASSCFDLLPVVRSHVFIKRISSVPILTEEEKAVVNDFCTKHKSLSVQFLSAILAQLKAERTTLSENCMQSLCRVYTALCRQNNDRIKANTLAYSLLKEDFPNGPKLLVFVVTTWPRLLICSSALSKAIHTVAHIRAEGEVLQCLKAYLHWDANPPSVPQLLSSMLASLCAGGGMQFQHHSRHGDDLCPNSWEYVFAVDLLCAQQKWKWTHDNIISKELWPIMNSWASQPRSQKGPIADVTVAAVLRLIGRLGQQGMKERFTTAVRKMASVINVLGKQGQAEGVPWEVQLATAYTIYDLSPSNPKEALAALAEWRAEATGRVPAGITSCLTQISSLSRKASS
ncbi:little elongation complex subunit 1 [Engraulis encrasicolus]|uniref:little elongation complex subunit 1 n=1 Tax=Engraulis encrasicolus TaxID=184585 RepID=UPI002FD56692